MVAVALRDSLVAVTAAEPTATPVTSPVADTRTAPPDTLQTIGLSGSSVPPPSRATALKGKVSPG